MFVAMDGPASAILLPIDLRPLLARQFPTVGLPVGSNLLIDALFPVLQMCCLARRQLPVADTVGDAILLILPPLASFVIAIFGPARVVLVS